MKITVLLTTAIAAIAMITTPAAAESFANGDPRAFTGTIGQGLPTNVVSVAAPVGQQIDYGALFGAQGREARKLARDQLGYQIIGTVVSDISGGIQDRRTITHQTDQTIRLRTAETGLQERFLVFQNNLQSQSQSSTCPNGQAPSITADGGKYCRIN